MGKKQQVPVTVSVRSEQVRDRPSAAICLSGFCCQLRNSTYGSAQVLQRMVTKSMSDAFIHRKWPVIIHKSLLHVPGPHLQDLRLLLLIQSFCIADWCIHAPPPVSRPKSSSSALKPKSSNGSLHPRSPISPAVSSSDSRPPCHHSTETQAGYQESQLSSGKQ